VKKRGGRVLFFKKIKEEEKIGEEGHVSCYNLNITN
jgi:hypothetical protein